MVVRGFNKGILIQVLLNKEVYVALTGLKLYKSPMLYKIYPRLLQETREKTTGTLTEIFKSSLVT